MARIEGKEVQDRLCAVFGMEPKDITPEMVFLLVKIAKHCRLRCRSNAALHNWVKRAFPDLDITTKKVQSRYKAGEMYDALVVDNPKQDDVEAEVEYEDHD